MRIFSIIKIGFLNFLIASFIWSQPPPADFEFYTLSSQDGLSNNTVNAICKDYKGFIWIGTEDGLNRYDGKTFKVYRHEFDDDNSISNNFIWTIYEDSKNNLWIGTRGGGLNKYDRDKDNFIHFQYSHLDEQTISHNEVYTMLEDKEGLLWIGTDGGGLNCYNPTTKLFKRFLPDTSNINSLSSNKILTLAEDANNNLWIGTWEGGVNILNKKTNTFKHLFHDSKNRNSLNSNKVRNIEIDSDGNIWFAMASGGVQKYIPSEKRFISFTHIPNNPNSLSNNVAYSIVQESENVFWISTKFGLNRLSFANGNPRFEHFYYNPDMFYSLPSDFIFRIYNDNDGIIWFASYDGGISRLNIRHKNFSFHNLVDKFNLKQDLYRVTTVLEESNGRLWIGMEGIGLAYFNKQRARFIRILLKPYIYKSERIDQVYSLFEDSKRNLWIGTTDGLFVMNLQNFAIEPVSYDPDALNGIPNPSVFQVLEDSNNIYWIATNGGLCKYDRKNKQFKSYFYTHDFESGYSLFRLRTIHLHKLNKRILLIGSMGGGLTIFNTETEDYEILLHDPKNKKSISSNYVHNIYRTSSGEIWVTTKRGINKFDPESKEFYRINTSNGLLSNLTYSILEDDHGFLWFNSEEGISKLNPHEKEITNYSYPDPYNHYAIFWNIGCKAQDGTIYFGSLNSLIYFHPDKITKDTVAPKVVITNFKIFNKNQYIGKDSPLKKNITQTSAIDLKHYQSSFSFEFAALSYTNPLKNNYKYMLKNFDQNWIESGNNNTANYTNIQPGEYVFHVIASNNNGIWNEIGKQISITIHPPFWRTIWFKILIVFFAIIAIYSIYLIRTYNIRRQKKILEEIVRSRTKELKETNELLQEKQEEIVRQNEELAQHQDNLELEVKERTSELEKAKKKAEESDRLKSAFLSNMSHEIRTPMNAILGFSSLLTQAELTDKEKEDYGNLIDANCESLLVLIDDIIDISKIEAEQVKLYKTNFIINSVFEEQYKYFSLKNQIDHVDFKLKISKKDVYVFSDRTRINQVLSNLISNAFKYTSEGRIETGFIVETKENRLKCFVKDTGVGISKEDQTVIFDRFTKIEKDTSALYRGTGLGLAISKKLIELLDGEIWVESEPNKGSIFYFTLPYNPKIISIPKPEPSKTENEQYNWKGKSIVVVEDEKDNYTLLEKILQPTGATIIWFDTGEKVVDFVKKEKENTKIDMILMDIKIPGLNGFEAVKEIKSIAPSIPVIAQTAFARVEEEIKIRESEFNDYISKPIKIDELLKTIAGYFKK